MIEGRRRYGWQIMVVGVLAFGGCRSDSAPESSSSTHWAECDSFADCADVDGATACDSAGYCVDQDGSRIGTSSAEPSSSVSGAAGTTSAEPPSSAPGAPCEERSFDACASDGECYVRTYRPIDVSQGCLLAPEAAVCASTHIGCPSGPLICLLDSEERPWFGAECGELVWAPDGHPCDTLVGGDGGSGGQGGIGARGLEDCPGVADAVAAVCDSTKAASTALAQEALSVARFECETDDDCVGSAQRFDCFSFCSVVSTAGNEAFEDLIGQARRACEGYEALGCEPEPSCVPSYGVCRNGRCEAESGGT